MREAADFLRAVTESPRNRQQYRLLMIWIFACARQEGWVDGNPVEAMRKTTAPRQRERLTIDQFEAIRASAELWLQKAMDLSLITLLRREDVCNLRFSDVHDDALWVVPGKTEDSTGARLKIRIGAELQALLDRCRDDVVSPYLIHRLPERARPREQRAESRVHHTQVLPEQLSRAFADARDASGLFEGVEHPPTFHEIRSLGGKRYQDRGWTLAQVQALMAHASPDMTQQYLAGHEVPWTYVTSG
ncbi:MAG: tyrosine-type recombinase/integrase [Nevskia sp.]|nr:tyrosine-type recombinase/integrase [Nevskia sp.]